MFGCAAQDTWTEDFILPRPDPSGSMDVQLVSAWQNASATAVVFRRKINSCDDKYDYRIQPGVETHISWARGKVWGKQHGDADRGMSAAVLLPVGDVQMQPAAAGLAVGASISTGISASVAASASSSAEKTFDVVMRRVTIPHNEETSYLCRHFAAPTKSKVHVTG